MFPGVQSFPLACDDCLKANKRWICLHYKQLDLQFLGGIEDTHFGQVLYDAETLINRIALGTGKTAGQRNEELLRSLHSAVRQRGNERPSQTLRLVERGDGEGLPKCRGTGQIAGRRLHTSVLRRAGRQTGTERGETIQGVSDRFIQSFTGDFDIACKSNSCSPICAA